MVVPTPTPTVLRLEARSRKARIFISGFSSLSKIFPVMSSPNADRERRAASTPASVRHAKVIYGRIIETDPQQQPDLRVIINDDPDRQHAVRAFFRQKPKVDALARQITGDMPLAQARTLRDAANRENQILYLDNAWGSRRAWLPEQFTNVAGGLIFCRRMAVITKLALSRGIPLQSLWDRDGVLYRHAYSSDPPKLNIDVLKRARDDLKGPANREPSLVPGTALTPQPNPASRQSPERPAEVMLPLTPGAAEYSDDGPSDVDLASSSGEADISAPSLSPERCRSEPTPFMGRESFRNDDSLALVPDDRSEQGHGVDNNDSGKENREDKENEGLIGNLGGCDHEGVRSRSCQPVQPELGDSSDVEDYVLIADDASPSQAAPEPNASVSSPSIKVREPGLVQASIKELEGTACLTDTTMALVAKAIQRQLESPLVTVLDPLWLEIDSGSVPNSRFPVKADCRLVAIPLHHRKPQHWSLAIIHLNECTVEYYDPLWDDARFGKVAKVLQALLEDKLGSRFSFIPVVSQQQDDNASASSHLSELPQSFGPVSELRSQFASLLRQSSETKDRKRKRQGSDPPTDDEAERGSGGAGGLIAPLVEFKRRLIGFKAQFEEKKKVRRGVAAELELVDRKVAKLGEVAAYYRRCLEVQQPDLGGLWDDGSEGRAEALTPAALMTFTSNSNRIGLDAAVRQLEIEEKQKVTLEDKLSHLDSEMASFKGQFKEASPPEIGRGSSKWRFQETFSPDVPGVVPGKSHYGTNPKEMYKMPPSESKACRIHTCICIAAFYAHVKNYLC
ncbi:hypothetical protein QBC47DRAFT_366002 [Echria macrotheca]|uniref:Ubiquitin-like protease family profile domain-containing protein n=1 Tax=Echria macrotheca TaxID=438768 RepID=A0AAJ0B3R6_9PEZI|nr:hypothetical protein QBC47DRAFT_366002 [Echria macrotheca]